MPLRQNPTFPQQADKSRFLFSIRIHGDRGFTILEVLIGLSLFMVGLLGVTALQISSLKSNTFAGNLSEATTLAAGRIDEIMSWDYDDPRLTDDDDNGTSGHGWAGSDEIGAAADDNETGLGRNGMYTIYMNISESDPMPGSKRINVIVYWEIKEVPRRIAIPYTLMEKL